ncbi:MAG TPA: endolytic transglycosylase MltG [Solirubrobacterales bacterium]|jgi:cell division protein YceG involved in septum cleavage|nr:endolytic transglycosylase MltG [Solirubrobacterales bacterium]
MSDDPFVEPDDPAAVERERRRLEREARRAKSPPPAEPKAEPTPEAEPPKPKKQPKQPKAKKVKPPRAPKPKPVHSRGRRVGIVVALGAVLLGIAAITALAYRHFHRASPPPPVVVRTVTLTVPEGYTRPQTAEITKAEGLRGSYEKASVHSKYLHPAKYGGKNAKDLEGFLFPDTFELVKHAKVADLVQLQLEDFKRRIAGVNMSYARSKNLTVYDVLTIASMIEHEAGLESQRKLVAAVIYNRLHEGMPLGIDATTRFATGNYTRPLTESELAVDSPYNTRTHTGLPPGPIGSPGLASIEAAAHPAKADYLYYVAEPGACNKLAFSSTEAEFNADVERYNAAREAAGGNSPDSCGE